MSHCRNRYINPFHPKKDGQVHYYHNDAPLKLEYKGYQVFQLHDRAFDIVKDGVCISQRCGYSKELIDRIDSGEDMYTTPTGPRR